MEEYDKIKEHGLLQIMYNQGIHRQWETTNQKKKRRRSEQKKCTMKNEDYKTSTFTRYTRN